MLRSALVAIVRAALSETFEVSAASTSRRCTGSCSSTFSSAVSFTAVERPARQPGASRRGQVVDQPLRLDQLAPRQPGGGRQRGLVVVAVDRGRRASVDQALGAVASRACGRAGSELPPFAPGWSLARSAPRACAGGPRSRRRWPGGGSVTSRGSKARRSAPRTPRTCSRIPTAVPRPRAANGLNDDFGRRITGRRSPRACRRGSGPTCCRRARSVPVRDGSSSAVRRPGDRRRAR